MDIRGSVNDLLAKEMDRKEFLAHLGGALLVMVGITGLIKSLTNHGQTNRHRGYGSGPYGGTG